MVRSPRGCNKLVRLNGAVCSDVDERAGLERLCRQNRELRMDREILRKAAAFFARETNR